MTDDLRSEHFRNKLCSELRSDGVKLWLPPYLVEDGNPNHKEIQVLSEKYAKKLNLHLNECIDIVTSIQKDALEKLQERSQLSQANLATLRIRCKGFNCTKSKADPGPSSCRDSNVNESNQVKVEIPLTACGQDLELALLKILANPDVQNVKFICDGRVLMKDKTLESQRVTNSSKIMALALSQSSQKDDASYWSVCDKTHSAVSTLLNGRDDNLVGGPEFEMEDQQGCSLTLDKKEKKSLVLPMTLHERGRAAMKRGNFSLALVLLSDADQQFKECNSELLKNVDNIALLNLDIVWCYLCLRSVSHLSDAERRLRECEALFEQCYGKYLERVVAMKGSAGNEAALLSRLHLLQGIVLFHQNKIESARNLLEQTKNEIQSLKVSQDDVNKVMLLGFSSSEALLALRATLGNIDAAVEKIIKDREDRNLARIENAKKHCLERERRKLGKTADESQYIEPENVSRLVNMGYDRYLAISALKHSNNNMSQAVFLIQEQPHLLSVKKKRVHPSNEAIAHFASLGFDVDVARLALQKHNGNIERAADDLLSNNGIPVLDPVLVSSLVGGDAMGEEEENSNDIPLSEEQLKIQEEEDLRVAEATEELEKDLPSETDDHLNLSLEMEEQFLAEYLSVLREGPH